MERSATKSRLESLVFLALTLGLLSFASSGCLSLRSLQSGITEIRDLREVQSPDTADLSPHNNRDVEVNRIYFLDGEAYEIIFYRYENDVLRDYRVYYREEETFHEARYSWLTDSSLRICLSGPDSPRGVKLKLRGKGSSTSMKF